MKTRRPNSRQVQQALRTRSADAFTMKVPYARTDLAPLDINPLCRSLHRHSLGFFEINEHMCVGLWKLGTRR